MHRRWPTPPKLDTLVAPLTGLSPNDPPAGTNPPRIIIGVVGGIGTSFGGYTNAQDAGALIWTAKVTSKVIGFSKDKKAGWIAADLRLDQKCMTKPCPKPDAAHATLLLEDGTPWQPVLVHAALPATEKQAADAGAPPSIERKVGAGAEDVVKQFESTIGDPNAFANTVSKRKDAVLYGSRQTEKSIGGAAMKATLKKWGLAMKVRDGLQAGVTANKTIAWIAANVDTQPAKKTDTKATPYRATFIYEQTPKGWELVSAQFSAYVPTI